MKLKDFEVTVSAVVAVVTVFLGVSGYVSVRFQANLLGISQGALTPSWRYVLDAAEFALAVVVSLVLGSTLLVLVQIAVSGVQHFLPRVAGSFRNALLRALRSALFARFVVAITLLVSLAAVVLLSSEPRNQAV